MIRTIEIVMLALLFGSLPAMVLAHGAKGPALDPICHQYYEMIQSPDLTYEDVGRIAEAMYHKQCWPAMHGETPPLAQTAGGLPSCEYLSEKLVNGSTNIRKLFDVRPMVGEDCVGGENATTGKVFGGLTIAPNYLDLEECQLLVNAPERLANKLPEIGLRPVNCRGKILYDDSSKSGFYFYMEQYSDGDNGVWGMNISRWGW